MNTIIHINKINGEVVFRQKLERWFSRMLDRIPEGEHLLEINPTDRTDQQNKYYWVCVNLLAKTFGISPNELHEHFKSEWLPSQEYFILVKKKQLKSTTDLYKDQMCDYIDKVVRFAADQGIVLPDVEEYKHQY